MRGAWRVADVRAAEEELVRRLPSDTLMHRAATGLARRCALLLSDRYGGVYGRSVLLLVGGGNNGGDALFAGAALARRGVQVLAWLLVPERVHAGGLAALRAAGGALVDGFPSTVDLVVDGIVGIGGTGGLREPAATIVPRLPELRSSDGGRPAVVAVDLPSGVDIDTGHVPGVAVAADVTVTFGCLKPGLVVGPAVPYAGQVELVDIGLAPFLPADPAVRVPELADVRSWWPIPGPEADKYRRGVVGLATGSVRYPGAALLSVAGALAGPAGMVRYAGTAAPLISQRHPSVIVTERVGDAGRVQAWACGSGLGTDDVAVGELRAVLAADVPAVLDADALTLIAEPMSRAFGERRAPTVVTPHDREFARLAGVPPGEDRVLAAQRLAAQMNVVVLLKGHSTIVATPSGAAWANPTGTPALATGGTGDVLTGLLGSLLAAGLGPEHAAVAAAYVHGLAGREAARRGSVTAADVAEVLPEVVGEVLAGGQPALPASLGRRAVG